MQVYLASLKVTINVHLICYFNGESYDLFMSAKATVNKTLIQDIYLKH